MQETWVRTLSGEDPLEKEMAAHSSILAWKIPWTEKPVGYSPWGYKQLAMTEQLSSHSLGRESHGAGIGYWVCLLDLHT